MLKVGEADQAIVNEAKLLKGKSLFFHYQSMQHVFLQRRGAEAIKEVEKLKQECYDSTKEAILILGSAQDHDFLDEEGLKLLDFAMIDYLRETNDLNSCERCLLCHRKTKLRRSHVFPKSILKDIAADLITGDDHKVFSTMVGKIVKKSAGEMTFGMLCGKCEQCLCQNGENQFSEHVHHKICVNREVVPSQLSLPYGRWLYDFCVGILFRSIAVSSVFKEFRASGEKLHKIFCYCRKHLLSLPANVLTNEAEEVETVTAPIAPKEPLQINFFVNPTINASSCFDLEYILKAPAIFINPVCLQKGIYSHSKRLGTLLVHFDRMNILVQLGMPLPFVFGDLEISPHGGVLLIPEEYKRWQSLPTGVWKLFSAISQASTNLNNLKSMSAEDTGTAESTEKLKLVYSPENIVALNRSKVFSFLPSNIEFSCGDENLQKVTLSFPSKHHVLIHRSMKWDNEQEIEFFVVENCFKLYLVFVLSVPGWHILDGLFFDKYSSSTALPYLNGKTMECHPLSLSVIQALMEQIPFISEYILVKAQLS